SSAAYRAIRDSAVDATSARLSGIATQWAQLFEASSARQRGALRKTAENQAVQGALQESDPRARSAAIAALRTLVSPAGRSVVQLVNLAGDVVASVGDSTLASGSAASRETPGRVAGADSGTIGPLRATGSSVMTTSSMAVVISGAVHGYIVQSSLI